jgi:tetratricopeptide (TPR) repeat protein
VGEPQLGGDRRNEAFAAWRRFLEALAEQRPLVLVAEDIHWADESLLDFLDEFVDWVSDVPLLVVATARPELLERRPNWGGGKLNATTLALSPLTDDQTALLLGQLLGKPLLEAESQLALLERAGGNPLYAEQYAELFLEQGSTDELPLPETLQGIIAARLDGLPEAEKGLLEDAAVVGKVFWASSIGRDPNLATTSLHSLERKGFVRRQRRSSLEGESELAFAHALVRDVSYGQMPRADRARRHGAVAEWIEALGRPEDHAEMLAYHWRAALELVRASGTDDEGLAGKTRVASRDAGDRAFALNSFKAAAAHYEDALELWPDDTERPDVLFRLARAFYEANDVRREQSLETARAALLEVGGTDRAAELQALLALVSWYRGQGELTRDRVSRAEELAGTSVSASAARVLTVSARIREIAGDHEDGKRLGESALAMAGSLGLDELAAHALTTIGMAKQGMGDRTGIADIERALEVALEVGTPLASGVASNLAIQFMFDGNLQRADELWAESARLAERFGDEASLFFLSGPRLWLAFAAGRWDEALEAADAVIKECETGSPHTNEWLVRIARGSIRDARGDAAGALADHLRGIEVAREIQNPVYLAETLAHCAATLAGRGERDQALVMLHEVMDLTREHGMCSGLAICGLFADELGITDELRAAIEKAPGPEFRGWQKAFLLVLAGDLRGAADRFAAMGNTTFEARQRLHAGERLVASGQRAAGDVQLQKALAFYRSVGATYFIRRAEVLLPASA